MHPDYLTYLKDLPFTSCLNRDIRALSTASRSTISSKTIKRSQRQIPTTPTKVPSQKSFFRKSNYQLQGVAQEYPQFLTNTPAYPCKIAAVP
jgi:hypothetical protein